VKWAQDAENQGRADGVKAVEKPVETESLRKCKVSGIIAILPEFFEALFASCLFSDTYNPWD
jgi:hypothetical protein